MSCHRGCADHLLVPSLETSQSTLVFLTRNKRNSHHPFELLKGSANIFLLTASWHIVASMTFSRDTHDIIAERRSCRSFDERPSPAAHRSAWKRRFSDVRNGPPGQSRSVSSSLKASSGTARASASARLAPTDDPGRLPLPGAAFPPLSGEGGGLWLGLRADHPQGHRTGQRDLWLAGTFDRFLLRPLPAPRKDDACRR
jgi:hypothetical protein